MRRKLILATGVLAGVMAFLTVVPSASAQWRRGAYIGATVPYAGYSTNYYSSYYPGYSSYYPSTYSSYYPSYSGYYTAPYVNGYYSNTWSSYYTPSYYAQPSYYTPMYNYGGWRYRR